MYQTQGVGVRELTDRLNGYRHEYYNLNAPSISDEVYDRLYDELERLENETGCRMSNSPTQTVGFKVVSNLETTVHEIPLLSLEKTKLLQEVMGFIGDKEVLFMLKLDGLTAKLEYEDGKLIRVSTRGDGNQGEIITHNAYAIDGIPSEIPYREKLVVTGETYILKSTFERLKETLLDSTGKPYRNARNLASGSARSYDSAACAKRGLCFTPFKVLEGLDENEFLANSKAAKLNRLVDFGFSKCEAFVLKNPTADELETSIQRLQAKAEALDIPIDGIVITYDDIVFSNACGKTGHHYKDSRAFKFADDLHETVLRSIEWTPTRFGEISPVAIFDTVEIDGCEVSRASLHNLTFIKDLELMPGCHICVSKRNLIIPHIEDNLQRGMFNSQIFPSVCPCCDSPTRINESKKDKERTVETLFCDNPSCEMKNLRRFVHFVGRKALDIDGLSEATLEKFIERGWLNTFTDIFRLDRYEEEIINSLEGFGEKSWERLWGAIQKSRNTTFERFVISLDIPMIGNNASKALSRQFSSDINLFKAAVEDGFDFTSLEDFGETLNRNIHQWFKNDENKNLWEDLKTMTNIEKTAETAVKANGNPFEGSTIVATGKLNLFTRSEINMKIMECGAKPGDSVTKNTNYLICGEKAGSKLAKAEKLGIPVLTEQQFLEMIEGA